MPPPRVSVSLACAVIAALLAWLPSFMLVSGVAGQALTDGWAIVAALMLCGLWFAPSVVLGARAWSRFGVVAIGPVLFGYAIAWIVLAVLLGLWEEAGLDVLSSAFRFGDWLRS